MATRSRRLRKKLCVDEFQELGFEVHLNYREDLSEAERNAAMEDFLAQAIEANGLGFIGADDFGYVCLGRRGSVSPEQRAQVEAWLKARGELAGSRVGELIDVWYPDKPIHQAQ
ncbi:MAG TPA: 50S ribosome-binding protein YggL [Pseudomonas sp.]|jgi:uncharacterized protein YggL (DUF469 family)|nr:50S ribosome-binding protein YggL [Pseudomonas sp.]